APGAGPGGRVLGVDDLIGESLLVSDEGAVRSARAVDAGLPAGLPEELVAAEEGEMDAGIAGGLNVGALRAGPVLVVAHGEEDLMVLDQRALPIAVHPTRVGDVVAVRLQPAHHRVLPVEQRVGLAGAAGERAGAEGAIVADLVGPAGLDAAAGAGADVETVAAVVVVGLPGGIGSLKEKRRSARIIADNEDDVAGAIGIGADEF